MAQASCHKWVQLPSGKFINMALAVRLERNVFEHIAPINHLSFESGWTIEIDNEDARALGLWLVGVSEGLV